MRRAVVTVALALAIAGAGCGSSSNVKDYCHQGVQALCARLFGCDPETATELYGSQSNCVSQNEGQCSNGDCTGGKTFDQSAADQCLAAYPSASCSDLEHGIFPEVCSQVCR
jgi:hypothetical protein